MKDPLIEFMRKRNSAVEYVPSALEDIVFTAGLLVFFGTVLAAFFLIPYLFVAVLIFWLLVALT
jgi:uncharacterized membrane protein